jgi:hypothetical protein
MRPFQNSKIFKIQCTFYSELITFLTHVDAAGQFGAAHGGSHMYGKRSLVQDVCASALELSLLLEALKARQRS